MKIQAVLIEVDKNFQLRFDGDGKVQVYRFVPGQLGIWCAGGTMPASDIATAISQAAHVLQEAYSTLLKGGSNEVR